MAAVPARLRLRLLLLAPVVLAAVTRTASMPPWSLDGICPARRFNFSATSWVHTCGYSGDDTGDQQGDSLRCRNFTNLAPAIVISDVYFGDHANVTVPETMHSGTPGHPCGTEGNPAPERGGVSGRYRWPAAGHAQPPHRQHRQPLHHHLGC